MKTGFILARRLFATALLFAVCGSVDAESALKTVQAFFNGLDTMNAEFQQQVIDSNNLLQQDSHGRMWIQRPGRFRWDYESPYRQQIVADGQRLWSYDEDLAQVTVQPLSEILTATPAMLLSGAQPLEELFLIEELPAGVGTARVRLMPRSETANVDSLQLYFVAGDLEQIEAQDGLGNTTVFRFINLKRNSPLEDSLFIFKPPAGADIIGNAG